LRAGREKCVVSARKEIWMPKSWSNKRERQYEKIKQARSRTGRRS